MKLRTNRDKLVKVAVEGKVAPCVQWQDFEVAHDGTAHALPSTGGITYNVKVGDPTFGWAGDHIEPGVSTTHPERKSDPRVNMGYNFLACIGNRSRVVGGSAKGSVGTVTGKHGGVEHVMIDFEDSVLNKLSMDDRFLIEAYGQGLKLLDFPDVKVYSLGPDLLEAMGLVARGGKLEVPVTTIVPAELMGSGIGSTNIGTGDYDIITHEPELVEKYRLDKICFGDFVAVLDHDNSYGRTVKRGAVSIGVVVHSNSLLAGHGPGITTVLTCPKPILKPVLKPGANIARLLRIGRFRKR